MKIAIKTVFATDYFVAMPYTEAWGARNAVYGQPVNHRNLISWGNTAEELYNTGIVLSIQEYYNYYKNSTPTGLKDANIAVADVLDGSLKTWLTSSTFKFSASKALGQIATRKWINFGILQPFECWAEYRLTDLPILIDDIENGNLLNKVNASVIFLYPANEDSMNYVNFQTVVDRIIPIKGCGGMLSEKINKQR